MLLGAHESIADGYYKAILLGKEDGCDCVQIFTKSPRMWGTKKITDKEAEEFKLEAKKENFTMNVSHASYLINLAAEDKIGRRKSVQAIINELECAGQLGLKGVVLHPGTNKSDERCRIVADSINEAFSKEKSKTFLILETTAGQGSVVGSTFEELKGIIDNVKEKHRVRICFDTCHAFASGYDLRTREKLDETFEKFDKVLGLDRLFCFHLNDSRKGFGEKIDRHENIGEGKIGIECFKVLVNDKRFKDTPGYLETPPYADGKDSYSRNIKKLRSLIK